MSRVLVIKLGALGDTVMATALLPQIQRFHKDSAVHLLTSDTYGPLFHGWPGIETTVFPRRGVGAMWHCLRWMRALRFGRVYDLQSNDRSGFLCALSGIPERVGNHPRYPYNYYPAQRYRGSEHIAERMLLVLRAAGIAAQATTPWLPATAVEQTRVRRWLQQQQLADDSIVLLHAGASARHPEKRWPYFRNLARELLAHDLRCVWIGGAEDRDYNRQLSSGCGIDASAEFSLPELAELGRHARFAVTNDSGPMHVLSCAGIPVYGLFGPSDWRRNHAIGQRDHVITPADDALFVPRSLAGLGIDRVLARIVADGHITRAGRTSG